MSGINFQKNFLYNASHKKSSTNAVLVKLFGNPDVGTANKIPP